MSSDTAANMKGLRTMAAWTLMCQSVKIEEKRKVQSTNVSSVKKIKQTWSHVAKLTPSGLSAMRHRDRGAAQW